MERNHPEFSQEEAELSRIRDGMRSPLFGFTEQELADIRLVDRKISYYDALLQSRTDFPKVETFLQRLDFLRTFACDQPVYRLLWEI